MKVLFNNVLIKPHKTESKIIITSGEPELSPYAEVVSVGDNVQHIKEGDQIFWSARSGTPFTMEDQELILIDASSIFVIL